MSIVGDLICLVAALKIFPFSPCFGSVILFSFATEEAFSFSIGLESLSRLPHLSDIIATLALLINDGGALSFCPLNFVRLLA
uniref:Uncharacterized protein n=1 Tax=Panstrongylus lignarius TaxID=156445 RepID=A0A224Y363_9HEMI